MNEEHWFAHKRPFPLLEYLRRARRYRPTRRKLHLYACRCVRRIRGLFAFAESDRAIFVAERFADGLATPEQLHAARVAAQRAVNSIKWADFKAEDRLGLTSALDDYQRAKSAARAAMALTHDPPSNGRRAIPLAINRSQRVISRLISSLPENQWDAEYQAQADLIRCIFGNPYAKGEIEPGWLTSAVMDLASSIYEKRAFKDLPILADALEEAGCTNPVILQHCRGPGLHGRGCWVVDAILGKK